MYVLIIMLVCYIRGTCTCLSKSRDCWQCIDCSTKMMRSWYHRLLCPSLPAIMANQPLYDWCVTHWRLTIGQDNCECHCHVMIPHQSNCTYTSKINHCFNSSKKSEVWSSNKFMFIIHNQPNCNQIVIRYCYPDCPNCPAY